MMRDIYSSLTDYAFGLIHEALRGVPVTASAVEINLRLWVQIDIDALPMCYATWRRAVRAVQAERARWAEWEGRDPSEVRPLRKGRKVYTERRSA